MKKTSIGNEALIIEALIDFSEGITIFHNEINISPFVGFVKIAGHISAYWTNGDKEEYSNCDKKFFNHIPIL